MAKVGPAKHSAVIITTGALGTPSVNDAFKQGQLSDPKLAYYTELNPNDVVNVMRNREQFDYGDGSVGVESALASLPTPSRYGRNAKTGLFKEATSLLGDDQAFAEANGYYTPGSMYNPTEAGNLAADARTLDSGKADGPAPISEHPTRTSKPERPRTIAAGYDPERQVLTVMFRDGTMYNYYDVEQKIWDTFRGLPSKWKFIKDKLDSKPRGNANLTYQEAQDYKAEFYISSTVQQITGGVGEWRPNRQSKIPKPKKISQGKGGKNPAGAVAPKRPGKRKR
jgi:hypothetical protein